MISFLLYIPYSKIKKFHYVIPGALCALGSIYLISFLSEFYFQHYTNTSYGLITSVLLLLFYMFMLGFIILISSIINSTLIDLTYINQSDNPKETFKKTYDYYDSKLIKTNLSFKKQN